MSHLEDQIFSNKPNSPRQALMMPPPPPAYDLDWIIERTGNVHIATDRRWFETYQILDTFIITPSSDRHSAIGIGTVNLPVRAGRLPTSPTNPIRISHVLHVPSFPCNFICANRRVLREYHIDAAGDFVGGQQSWVGLIGERRFLGVGQIPSGRARPFKLLLHGQADRSSVLGVVQDPIITPFWPAAQRDSYFARRSVDRRLSALETHRRPAVLAKISTAIEEAEAEQFADLTDRVAALPPELRLMVRQYVVAAIHPQVQRELRRTWEPAFFEPRAPRIPRLPAASPSSSGHLSPVSRASGESLLDDDSTYLHLDPSIDAPDGYNYEDFHAMQ